MVGVNGAGKSTFLKVLAGQTEPTGGSVTLGANVELGYFSQHAMEVLDPKKTVFETVQDAMPLATIGVHPQPLRRLPLLRGMTSTSGSKTSPAAKRAGWCWRPCWRGRSTS